MPLGLPAPGCGPGPLWSGSNAPARRLRAAWQPSLGAPGWISAPPGRLAPTAASLGVAGKEPTLPVIAGSTGLEIAVL